MDTFMGAIFLSAATLLTTVDYYIILRRHFLYPIREGLMTLLRHMAPAALIPAGVTLVSVCWILLNPATIAGRTLLVLGLAGQVAIFAVYLVSPLRLLKYVKRKQVYSDWELLRKRKLRTEVCRFRTERIPYPSARDCLPSGLLILLLFVVQVMNVFVEAEEQLHYSRADAIYYTYFKARLLEVDGAPTPSSPPMALPFDAKAVSRVIRDDENPITELVTKVKGARMQRYAFSNYLEFIDYSVRAGVGDKAHASAVVE